MPKSAQKVSKMLRSHSFVKLRYPQPSCVWVPAMRSCQPFCVVGERGHFFVHTIFIRSSIPTHPPPLPSAHLRILHFANKEMCRRSGEEIEGRPMKQKHFSFVCCCSDCHTPGALGVYRPSAVSASQVQSLFPC